MRNRATTKEDKAASFDGAPDMPAGDELPIGTSDSGTGSGDARARLVYPFDEAPLPGRVMKVAPGIWWLRMALPFSLKWINLYAIDDDDGEGGNGIALVDCGMALEDTKESWRALFSASPAEGGLGIAGFYDGTDAAPRRVTRIIVTHMHPDHVGLAGWLCRMFDCPLFMTRLEYVTCRVLVADTGRAAPEEGVRHYRACGWDAVALERYRDRFGRFGAVVSPLPESFVRLSDGDRLVLGGREWVIITGAGHSPEHACLYCPGLKLLISGDQVLPRISSNVSVHPTEPDADPLSDWLHSCRKLRNTIPDDVLVLPAHNEPFYGLHARLDALISGHERGLVRVLRKLEGDKRVIDLFGALFARAIGEDLMSMATGETLAHLNCLLRRDFVTRHRDETGIDYWRKRG